MTAKSQAERVVERFGGAGPMAKTTEIAEQSIRNWIRSGHIPQKHHLQILVAARAAGVDLSPADFVAHLVEQLIAHLSGPAASETPAVTAAVAG
jgi:hypothetical protein